MDEVFVDLCRQMLRKDDSFEAAHRLEDDTKEYDPYKITHHQKRRKSRRDRTSDPGRPKCVIL